MLHKIITRTMKLLTRRGVLVEEEGSTYMADNDGDSDEARVVRPLQAAACINRIAFGPRAGQKVLTLQGVMPREADFKHNLCADIDGFSLHAAVRCGADDRQALEQLCRYITRPALANERVQTNAAQARYRPEPACGSQQIDEFPLAIDVWRLPLRHTPEVRIVGHLGARLELLQP